ncbi:hypothetical protein DERF_004860 [Dermatophagoides farinae]|uniref:Uncharacterized protein n=1 Tax=Dermatophagoides farinae TaxID=6954 RepID=A0A922L850_DERFA|nr:hypothetical protein DERF_004860 [Dermatophagoides farinae]
MKELYSVIDIITYEKISFVLNLNLNLLKFCAINSSIRKTRRCSVVHVICSITNHLTKFVDGDERTFSLQHSINFYI